jgi:TetR/AcrR family transcriptional regulator, transcriptional repressor for nem operon
MPKPSHREILLTAGLRLIHEKGFSRASVRDIVTAAAVPQGSFTNHFRTKEQFGLAVLERYYYGYIKELMERTLLNEKRRPLERIRSYVNGLIDILEDGWTRKGCILGNFTAELTDDNEAIRRRVVEMFDEMQAAVKNCLKDAIRQGDLPRTAKAGELAGFFMSSQQGATLLCKAHRSVEPMRRFKRLFFSSIFAKNA